MVHGEGWSAERRRTDRNTVKAAAEVTKDKQQQPVSSIQQIKKGLKELLSQQLCYVCLFMSLADKYRDSFTQEKLQGPHKTIQLIISEIL